MKLPREAFASRGSFISVPQCLSASVPQCLSASVPQNMIPNVTGLYAMLPPSRLTRW
jgi:hypothetical protein